MRRCVALSVQCVREGVSYNTGPEAQPASSSVPHTCSATQVRTEGSVNPPHPSSISSMLASAPPAPELKPYSSVGAS